MDQALKSRWLAALRSGKYTQGQGRLQRTVDNGQRISPQFCCLGVLCDIVEPDGWHVPLGSQPHHTWGSTKIFPSYLDSLGLSPREQDRLVDLNDAERQRFAEIARWIEKNL